MKRGKGQGREGRVNEEREVSRERGKGQGR